MNTAYAPYRVSLFGGGTDYPEWYNKKGGIAVNFTIRAGIRVGVQEEDDGLTRQAVEDMGWVAKRIVTKADFPRETGLGGSAAYAVALAAALQGKLGVKESLAIYGFNLERGQGRVVGMQDHLAAAIGGPKVYWFRPGGNIDVEEWRTKKAEEMARHMMMIHIPREVTGSAMAERYRGVDMERTYQRALMGLAAIEKEDWEKVGYELYRAWEEKRGWVVGMATARVNQLIEFACRAGAWGGKLMGAGSGGMVLLMAEDCQELYGRLLRGGFGGQNYGVEVDREGVRMVEDGEFEVMPL